MERYQESWSLFQIRQQKSPEALPDGDIAMTTYPACNKTTLSRKPCIADKKFQWNAIKKSWPLFQNLSRKIV